MAEDALFKFENNQTSDKKLSLGTATIGIILELNELDSASVI